MQHARVMSSGKPAPRSEQHLHDLVHRMSLHQPLAKRLAFDELHREKHGAFVRANIERGDDVRMRQLRERLRLAQEATVVTRRLRQHAAVLVQ
jgi:hypothetical protein